MAVAGINLSDTQFYHPGTNQCVDFNKPESTPDGKKGNVFKRIARKAGYEQVSGNAWKKTSWLSKFKYFSAGSRNMHSTARAYNESGHFVTASILRETARDLHAPAKENTPKPQNIQQAEESVFRNFKDRTGIQKNLKRQDYVNHRTHMLESGDKTTESQAGNESDSSKTSLLPKTQTQNNRFSRIATKLSRVFMSACECTSAPTGFTFRALRNFVFHGVSDKGILHKGATAACTIFIGLGVSSIIKAIRGAAGTSGYGFNPIQILTGVLVAFAAVSGIAGGLSWISGLASQAAMKNIKLSDEQEKFIKYEMNSTLNKINELLISYKDSPGKMRMLNRAMEKKFPIEDNNKKKITVYKEDKTEDIYVHPLLETLYNALTPIAAQIEGELKALKTKLDNDPNSSADEKKAKIKNKEKELWAELGLPTAKQVLGKYLANTEGNAALEHKREKEFATLAGFVEHIEVDDDAKNPAHTVIFTDAKDNVIEHPKKTQNRKADRIDGRQFTEEFAQQMNRTLLTALATPARLLDMVFKTKTEDTLKNYADEKYSKNRGDNLKDPAKAHLHKYHLEYITDHLHQYGRITRALIKASEFIHDINYHYVLAVNAQTSRLYNKAAQAFQESVLGQHSSKIACSAFGRFMGGMTVTLVSFLGISALAHLTGGGSAASGFQNSSQIGSAKLSWLITGTLMTVVGLPAFALGLLAKGAAMAEGWRGDIEAPVTREMHAKQEKSKEQNPNNPYLLYV